LDEGLRIDHLGIAVRSLERAVEFYERALGFSVTGREEVALEKVRVAMLPCGGPRIELLEATSEDSPIARFIARRGEGLHHVALCVPDLEAAMERLQEAGARLASDKIQIGAGGHRYIFIHPSSASGVLLELVEERA
jgi:methylmalonyl-CoA epimerase